MSDKRRKPGVLHIKRFTEGKSNEISFSVLDARNNESNAAGKREKRGAKARFTGVFRPAPLSGVRPLWQGNSSKRKKSRPTAEPEMKHAAAPSTVGSTANVRVVSRETPLHHAAEKEIERRKAKRRRRRLLSGVFGTVLLLGALGAGGFYLHGLFEAESENKAILDSAIAQIEDTDDIVLEIDSLIGKKVDADVIGRLNELDAEIPSTTTELSEAKGRANGVLDSLRDSGEKEAAGQAINSAESRAEMLGEASKIIDLMSETYDNATAADAAWGSLLTADSLAREAASLVSETTEENVNASIERTQAAVEEFGKARESFESLSYTVDDLDVQPYIDYIDKRLESLDYAAASNEAILVQDKATAEENNEKYNQADAEAASLAEAFDGSPSDVIYDRYDQETETLFANYGNARTSAGTADSFLRDYLGTSGK